MMRFDRFTERAQEAALNGDGGGVIGSFFHVTLWKLLGSGGGWIALLAWFLSRGGF